MLSKTYNKLVILALSILLILSIAIPAHYNSFEIADQKNSKAYSIPVASFSYKDENPEFKISIPNSVLGLSVVDINMPDESVSLINDSQNAVEVVDTEPGGKVLKIVNEEGIELLSQEIKNPSENTTSSNVDGDIRFLVSIIKSEDTGSSAKAGSYEQATKELVISTLKSTHKTQSIIPDCSLNVHTYSLVIDTFSGIPLAFVHIPPKLMTIPAGIGTYANMDLNEFELANLCLDFYEQDLKSCHTSKKWYSDFCRKDYRNCWFDCENKYKNCMADARYRKDECNCEALEKVKICLAKYNRVLCGTIEACFPPCDDTEEDNTVEKYCTSDNREPLCCPPDKDCIREGTKKNGWCKAKSPTPVPSAIPSLSWRDQLYGHSE